ncbi:lipopolysaccharide assembly protein LapA domain-containing protein [Actinoplanes sp. NPDC026619]|uniref:LapA family protein n=1 Tax=Actinoplanes sp. NPDC026619 TaxID=3155798 RepID=UPI0033F4DB0F
MTLSPEERPERELPPQPPTTPADLPLPVDGTGGEIAPPPGVRQPFTRVRAAWVGVWAGIVVVILLIIFIGQNTAPVDVHFLWLDGQIPTALALLIAGVGGAIIAVAAGAARIVQLRRMMRRDH